MNQIAGGDAEVQTDSYLRPGDKIMTVSQDKNKTIKLDLASLIALSNLNRMFFDSYRKSSVNIRDIETMTDYYYNKVFHWIVNDYEFARFKKHLSFLGTKKGYLFIFKVLRKYIEKHNSSWLDLRTEFHHLNLKEYIRSKLARL